ncbi:hypothetical protein EDB85DRAFT_705284 [Lactarius pseudohatsudake]|nr:hypothetical protein EDB85DRAFT_705284 [Lactarius pseudohatsudake]
MKYLQVVTTGLLVPCLPLPLPPPLCRHRIVVLHHTVVVVAPSSLRLSHRRPRRRSCRHRRRTIPLSSSLLLWLLSSLSRCRVLIAVVASMSPPLPRYCGCGCRLVIIACGLQLELAHSIAAAASLLWGRRGWVMAWLGPTRGSGFGVMSTMAGVSPRKLCRSAINGGTIVGVS